MTTMRLSQTQILEHAERLASALAGGATRVEKNVLLAVVADFMVDRLPDRDKLRRTLRLLAAGNGGHLQRSKGYPDQIRTVGTEITRFLDAEDLGPEDTKSVFGWTARLLQVRDLAPTTKPASPTLFSGARKPTPSPSPENPVRPRPPAPKVTLGSISQKGLSDLQKFKQQLEERENKLEERK
jgi:hypothetical protein